MLGTSCAPPNLPCATHNASKLATSLPASSGRKMVAKTRLQKNEPRAEHVTGGALPSTRALIVMRFNSPASVYRARCGLCHPWMQWRLLSRGVTHSGDTQSRGIFPLRSAEQLKGQLHQYFRRALLSKRAEGPTSIYRASRILCHRWIEWQSLKRGVTHTADTQSGPSAQLSIRVGGRAPLQLARARITAARGSHVHLPPLVRPLPA